MWLCDFYGFLHGLGGDLSGLYLYTYARTFDISPRQLIFSHDKHFQIYIIIQ